jgi:peptidyl-prolyl cis-trans isomerase C
MRLPVLTGLLASLALSGALAQQPKPAKAPPPGKPGAGAPAAGQDPVIATVGDDKIHLSDLVAAEQGLPPQARAALPQDQIYRQLLDRMVASKALVQQARAEGLANDPAVQRDIRQAEDNVLQNAMLRREVLPHVSEEAIKAKYDAQIAGKPGPEEVHAEHILVDSESQAKDIIAQLKKGAKFEDLAKKYSKDPAAQQGGDLGFFKKDDMLPEFSNAAFAMKPGQISDTPVHTRYGWHVIKVLERRQAPASTYEQAHDVLRQQLIQEWIGKAIADARSRVKVAEFNPDGTPMKPDQAAAKPAAAGK